MRNEKQLSKCLEIISKKPFSVESKGDFKSFFLLLLPEFYISVPVAGGNSFLFQLKNCRGGEMLPQLVLVSLTWPQMDYCCY